MRTRLRRAGAIAVAVVLAVALVVMVPMSAAAVPLASPATPSGFVDYRPPSNAPIVDHFRPPANPWGAGNRGIDYGTIEGDEVRAAAPGRVVFAGEVGGTLHVTVEHADGLRTSYSFLAAVSVARGDRVRSGDIVGTAAGSFHFGVRAPDGTYFDPEEVLAGRVRPEIALVPGAEEGLDPLDAGERRSLLDTLRDSGVALMDYVERTGVEAVSIAAHAALSASNPARIARAAVALARWYQQSGSCTPASTEAPTIDRRRVAVEVSGLGTASESNSAWEFDTATIGYAPTDVIRFSYRGGRAPNDGEDQGITGVASESIPVTTFSSSDSQQSLGVSVDRLVELIDATARANPDVPIDVLAHSQGGVVARLAIERAAAAGQLPATVANLVTVGSPHGGAPLATGVRAMQLSPAGRMVLAELRSSGVAGPLDDRLPATTDLAATSVTMGELHDRPLPDQVRFVSLGGSGDLIVPGVATTDPSAADQRILPTAIGTDAHGALTSMPRTTREIALAVAGRPLTCQGLTETIGAFLEAEAVSTLESASTLGAATMAATTGVPLEPR